MGVDDNTNFDDRQFTGILDQSKRFEWDAFVVTLPATSNVRLLVAYLFLICKD
jgi:hypothetical protein